jgi:hypothetical protein
MEISVVEKIKINEYLISKDEKNKVEEIRLIAKILVYSAIKISANIPLLYSTLNPDTSSDSPSAKSKGVRLVSASVVINHIIEITISIKIVHELICFIIRVKSMFSLIVNIAIRIRAILIS